MPWYPPDDGGDVSFWYATYCAVGIGLMVSMGIYYWVWIKAIPKLRGYKIRTETLVSDLDGSVTHKLTKVPNALVEEWDRTHDEAGNVLIEVSTEVREADNKHLLKRVKVKDTTTVNQHAEEKL